MDPDPDPAPAPDSAVIVSELKVLLFLLDDRKKFFCSLLFKSTCTSFFNDKKSHKSHNAVGIKIFLTIFA